MAKKYIGTLGKWDFFVATHCGQYSDPRAVTVIQRARYLLITRGHKKNHKKTPIDIFCSAINIDHLNKRESNPFDYLDTTYHFFALGNKKAEEKYRDRIGCALSCALESNEMIKGERIGLPLENKANPYYPRGYDLDPFRKKYAYDGKKSYSSERLELYRHFKMTEHVGDKAAGLGVYKSCNNEFIVNRIRAQKTPITKWLFCSKPAYYEYIYRPFGAMLIPLLLNSYGLSDTSPSLKNLSSTTPDKTYKKDGLYYKNTRVSYRHPLFIARNYGDKITERWFDYLPLLVDWDRSHAIIKTSPNLISYPHLSKIAWRIICEYKYDMYHSCLYHRLINEFAKLLTKSYPSVGW